MFMYGVLYSIEISQFGVLEYVIMTFLVELGAPNLRVMSMWYSYVWYEMNVLDDLGHVGG